jgi:tRNA threonylcarbamoyl adenosine modification protein (Sua5/YciO/YrdC/YwlC family)
MLFEAKHRPPGLNVPVLVPDAASAWQLVVTTWEAGLLAHAFWPGALTMVLPRTDRSLPWSLGDHAGTLGVRVPADPVSEALLRAAGPLAATSANLSGRPPLGRADELMQAFGEAVAVYVVAPVEVRGSGSPSTVVDLTGSAPSILRRGQIDPDRILAALG